MLKKCIKIFLSGTALFAAFAVYVYFQIPDDLYSTQDGQVNIRSLPMVTVTPAGHSTHRAVTAPSQALKYSAKLFGVVPLREVNVSASAVRKVAVAGIPFGIKMFSDGVKVVGISDIETSAGYTCPAKNAGIKAGDVIIRLGNTEIKSIDDVEKYLEKNGTADMTAVFLRDGVEMSATFAPVVDVTANTPRTGMWVRDSSAGVGTMTFYDVQKSMFAGLGHGIKDADTQKDIRLLSGEIVPVKITGVTKSHNGEAGELKGIFTSSFATGKILANSTNGVYGTVFDVPKDNIMAVAPPQDITTGAAQILTTVSGSTPQKYDIVIEKIALNGSNSNKNMIIRITAPKLLSITGGIVQGMSGSPIIQNGKLVGAVTHVFVNQGERGYAVFAQNMLDSMDNTEKVYIDKAG